MLVVLVLVAVGVLVRSVEARLQILVLLVVMERTSHFGLDNLLLQPSRVVVEEVVWLLVGLVVAVQVAVLEQQTLEAEVVARLMQLLVLVVQASSM